MKPYPPELHEAAEQLRGVGLSYNRISHELGVPYSTIVRWLRPEYAEQQRAVARRNKLRYRGTCEECGASTSYSGKRRQGSRLCRNCAQQPGRYRFWTRELVLMAIKRWAAEHGKPPSATDWIRRGSYWPPVTAVYQGPHPLFPSWSAALRAAGFTPRKSPPGPHRHAWPREEARRLWDAGLSATEIAARYDVTPSAITNVFGRRYPDSRPKKQQNRTRSERIADLQKALTKSQGAP